MRMSFSKTNKAGFAKENAFFNRKMWPSANKMRFLITNLNVKNVSKRMTIYIWSFEIWDPYKSVYCVDLDENFQMSIYFQTSASIETRTSPPKFGVPVFPRTPMGRINSHVNARPWIKGADGTSRVVNTDETWYSANLIVNQSRLYVRNSEIQRP